MMPMSAIMKSCDEVRDFIMDYLDKRLTWKEAAQFRLHMLLCPNCKSYFRRYNTSIELTRNILNDPPPQELVDLTTEFLKKKIARK